jgi:hypothetical protein
MWNERGFGLVGRTQLGVAARCGLDALVATAELNQETGGELELLEAAEAFRRALPDSALIARLGGKRFAAMVVPGAPEVAGGFEAKLVGGLRVHWTTLRPQPDFGSGMSGDLLALCENVGVAARAGRHL